MANAAYDTYKQDLQGGTFNVQSGGDTVKASLIDLADYTFSASHSVYGGATPDVPSAAKVAESAGLSGQNVLSDGTFDTDDFTWSSVTGDESEAIILWDDTVTDDRLMIFYDTNMTGMPVTPNGGDINVTVNTSGWYTL